MSEEIPKGWLIHASSKKPVHPEGGDSHPGNNTYLVTYSGGVGESRIQVQFEPVEKEGHFGYIRHVTSGKYVHPYGGDIAPGDNTSLVYYSGKHSACLMCFDEINDRIIQKGSNKIWHPYGGDSNPGNNVNVVLNSDAHDAAKFYMADSKGNRISPYPTPTLSGRWIRVFGIENSATSKVYEETVVLGEERTQTTTVNNAWNMSANVAYGLFAASAEYSGFVEESTSVTWSRITSNKLTISVNVGDTFGTWQWEFDLSQYGDAYVYHSDYYQDTTDPNTPPPAPVP